MATGHVIGDVIARRIRISRYSAEHSGIRTRVRPDLYSEVHLYCLDDYACCAHQHKALKDARRRWLIHPIARILVCLLPCTRLLRQTEISLFSVWAAAGGNEKCPSE